MTQEKRPVPIYEPLNLLKPIAENIWIVDGNIIEMSAIITKIPFSTRMTVVKLANGQIWCHSPIAPDDGLFEQLDALGPVAHLISPNKLHYAYIAEWKKRYPKARAWASPGVEKRATKQQIDIDFDEDLTDKAPSDWSFDMEQLIFKGSRLIEEVVFFHKASKTLIVADVIENFEVENMPNSLRRGIYKLVRIAAPDGQTPLDYRLTFLGKQGQAKANLLTMLDWQPDKIILAHGSCFLENGSEQLKRALRWVKLDEDDS